MEKTTRDLAGGRSPKNQERSMVSRPIGFGLQILEDLYSKHRPRTSEETRDWMANTRDITGSSLKKHVLCEHMVKYE